MYSHQTIKGESVPRCLYPIHYNSCVQDSLPTPSHKQPRIKEKRGIPPVCVLYVNVQGTFSSIQCHPFLKLLLFIKITLTMINMLL